MEFDRARNAAAYELSLVSAEARTSLRRALCRLFGDSAPADGTLLDRVMRLPWRSQSVLFKLTAEELIRIPTCDLVTILRRYETGDEQGRSAWRRACRRHKLHTGPKPGRAANRKEYLQRHYVATRGRGKRLDLIRHAYDVLEFAATRDVGPFEAQRAVGAAYELLRTALSMGKEKK